MDCIFILPLLGLASSLTQVHTQLGVCAPSSCTSVILSPDPPYACRDKELTLNCEVINGFSLQWVSEPDIPCNRRLIYTTGDDIGETRTRGSYRSNLTSVTRNPLNPYLSSVLTFTPTGSMDSVTVVCGHQLSQCPGTEAKRTLNITDAPIVTKRSLQYYFINNQESCPNVSVMIEIEEMEDIATLTYKLNVSSSDGCVFQECPMLLKQGQRIVNMTLLNGVEYTAMLTVLNGCGSGSATVLFYPVCEARATDPPPKTPANSITVDVDGAIGGVLVGGAIGGVIIGGVVVGAVVFCICGRRKKKKDSDCERQAVEVKMKEDHKKELQTLEVKIKEDHEKELQTLEVKMKEDHKKELQTLEVKMKEDHEKELQTLEVKIKEDHEKELQTLEVKMKDHEEELQTLEVKMKEDHEKELHTLEVKMKDHEKELQTLEVKMTEDHKKELQTLEVKIKEDHEKELQTLEVKIKENHEKELQTLEVKMKEDHEKELQTLEEKIKKEEIKKIHERARKRSRRRRHLQDEGVPERSSLSGSTASGATEYPLHTAAKKHDLEKVKQLVDERADVNIQDNNERTALHIAVERAHTEIVKYLVAGGADITIKDDNGMTPLHVAAERGRCEILGHLIDKGGDTVINITDEDGRTPLHVAVREGQSVTVEFLAHSGAKLTIQDYHGMTPFHIAAERGRCANILGYLIAKGGVTSINIKDEDGRTPLHVAVEEGQECTVETLVEKYQADINSKDNNGMTPLHVAVERGDRINIMKYLLNKGADIDTTDSYGRTPIHIAAKEGREYSVRTLVKKGADISIKDNAEMTPRSLANESGHVKIKTFLEEERSPEKIQEFPKNINMMDGMFHHHWHY